MLTTKKIQTFLFSSTIAGMFFLTTANVLHPKWTTGTNRLHEIKQNDKDKLICNSKLCVAEISAINEKGDSLKTSCIKIPSEALFRYTSKRTGSYKYRVVRIKSDSLQNFKLKSIRVKLIKDDIQYAFIDGLNPGDSLLINPRTTLKELVKIDKLGLRKAFSMK
ncbi:MAG: hypothetical protein ACM34K_21295 [Bacillota bacterium]